MHANPRARRASLITAGIALIVLLSGCFKMEMNVTVYENNMASADLIVAISDETATTFGLDPQQLWNMAAAEMITDLPDNAETRPYAQDGWTGSRFTIPRSPLSEFQGAGTEELNIVREGNEFVVTGALDMADAAGSLDDMSAALLAGMDIRVSITFPGRVIESNGSISGNTVTWRPVIGELNEINARASAIPDGAAGGMPLWLVILIAAAVGAVIGVAIAVILGAKKGAADADTTVVVVTDPWATPVTTDVDTGEAAPATGDVPAATADAAVAAAPVADVEETTVASAPVVETPTEVSVETSNADDTTTAVTDAPATTEVSSEAEGTEAE